MGQITTNHWSCPNCGHVLSTTDWTYSDLGHRGVPICHCDVDMELTDTETTTPPPLTLDDLLDTWSVLYPDMWENDIGPSGWYAVCNDDGIVAYFGNESDALRWRLAMINRELNH